MTAAMAVAATLALSCIAAAETITLWDFQSPDNQACYQYGSPGYDRSIADFACEIGSGTISFTGNVAFNKMDYDFDEVQPTNPKYRSGDPIHQFNTPTRGYGMSFEAMNFYHTLSAVGVDGVRFSVPTVGWMDDNIKISLDIRAKAYNSKYGQIWYTVNGSTWNPIGSKLVFDMGDDTTDQWFNHNELDLSGLGVANNPNFAFKFTEAWNDQGGWSYAGIETGSKSKWRFDMVEVFSGSRTERVLTPVPEPSSILALVSGIGWLVAIRRRSA